MTENKIIEVLDYLFEKFGIAVDWTRENVMPYVQELAEKIVTYKIVQHSIWLVISIIAIVVACICAKKLYTSYQQCVAKKENNGLWKYDKRIWGGDDFEVTDTGGLMYIVAIILAVVGVVGFIITVSGLTKWIFIPEIKLVEYVNYLISTL